MSVTTQSPPAAAAKPAMPSTSSATGGKLIPTLRALWPYIWPADRRDLQSRVILSLAIMLVAKIVTVGVPYTFKWATNTLVAVTAGKPAEDWLPAVLIGAPILAAILYGVARIAMSLMMQVREAIFAPVAMHAVRRLALETFQHMHRLSLRFHLERKTGGLTRVLERGRNGIEDMSRMAMMTLVPTVVEFALVIAVFWLEFDWRYVVVVTVMIIVYVGFTIRATEWRIGIRKTMNNSDNDANAKAVDSLLNFETVKYFGSEERESARYDRSMAAYEKSSVKSYTSLAFLNSGQAVIFTAGLTLCMVMAVGDITSGNKSIGHFVMVNALLIQLSIPLNFMGMIYRRSNRASSIST